MRKNDNQDGSTTPPAEPHDPQRISPGTTVDGTVAGEIAPEKLEVYLAHLEHFDVPLRVKIELICTLQHIMQSFVDRAFGDDPTQLACGDAIDANVHSGSDVL